MAKRVCIVRYRAVSETRSLHLEVYTCIYYACITAKFLKLIINYLSFVTFLHVHVHVHVVCRHLHSNVCVYMYMYNNIIPDAFAGEEEADAPVEQCPHWHEEKGWSLFSHALWHKVSHSFMYPQKYMYCTLRSTCMSNGDHLVVIANEVAVVVHSRVSVVWFIHVYHLRNFMCTVCITLHVYGPHTSLNLHVSNGT